jgi:hypothetical protein
MISIDTVYQRVLAILNKENRGYLTPQEFNLFANQAQLEIFEQYFFDLNQYSRLKENNTEYANLYSIVEEKLSKFQKYDTFSVTSGFCSFASTDLHKIGSVIYNGVEVEKISQKQYNKYNLTKLAAPSLSAPVFIERTVSGVWGIQILPSVTSVDIEYVKKPSTAVWAYQNILGKAQYNASASTNFELHESEEAVIMLKILGYAGISIQDPNVIQIADAKENKKISQEKS